MTVLNIMKWPNAPLSTPCTEVTTFDESLRKFADDMLETMKHFKGIGLAANQVGSSKRMFVANAPDPGKDWDGKDMVFINPKIVSASGSEPFREGCLSFPDMYEFIVRSEAVSVAYQDIEGQHKIIEAKDLMAVVVQHEIDHLDGKTFLDRMSRLKKEMFMKKLEKAWWL